MFCLLDIRSKKQDARVYYLRLEEFEFYNLKISNVYIYTKLILFKIKLEIVCAFGQLYNTDKYPKPEFGGILRLTLIAKWVSKPPINELLNKVMC